MEEFVKTLEKMSRDAVNDIEQISEKIANDLRTTLPAEFDKVKAHISSLIKTFKAKIQSLRQRRISTNAGPSTTSLPKHIMSSLKTAEGDAESLLHKAKEEASAMIQEMRNMIKRMSDGLETARGDITNDIRKAGEDTLRSLTALGENAVKKAETLVSDVFKEIELDGSFVAKHSLQIAEAATISAINPIFVCSIAASLAMIVAAHKYAESIRKN
jgi:vacuolar-type H+-ATPase subunit H